MSRFLRAPRAAIAVLGLSLLLLADGHRNVCVVGDTDQCLPPGTVIDGPHGPRPIEEVSIGDVVHGAGGHATAQAGTVTHVHEGSYDGHIVEITAGGRTVRATPHHLLPARLLPTSGQWLVYLMYRADRGWRIGRTVGARPPRGGKVQHGLVVRTNQEHADAAWILKVCGSMRLRTSGKAVERASASETTTLLR